ncbi:hypothetical protein ACJZ2D_015622 [Fusarium nematophilum]
MTTRGLHNINVALSGPENQDIRLLIRMSRLRFTAINDCGIPFLAELLPLAEWCVTIRNALLALAGFLRFQTRPQLGICTPELKDSREGQDAPASAAALERYQIALSTLRERTSTLRLADSHDNDVLEVLGSALLLIVAGFPRTMRPEDSHDWSHHMRGMIKLIESLDPNLNTRSSIARLVKDSVAHLDIAAFSLGRLQKSHNCWLKWDMCPPEAPPASDFSSMEVIMGYPKSLLTIIATISAVFEEGPSSEPMSAILDMVKRLHHQVCNVEQPVTPDVASGPFLSTDSIAADALSKLETVLILWKPPEIPARLSSPVAIALTGAWEMMRKAALLYLWRGGFRANILVSLPAHRAAIASQFIREILFGSQTLLSLLESDFITIMNVMTWPLIVVGNEFIERSSASASPGQLDTLNVDALSRELGLYIPLF